MKYALFAFGFYYPNGGFSDFRGAFQTEKECETRFLELGEDLMSEQGYGRCKPNKHCLGQIVDLEKLQIVKELKFQ